MKFGRNLIKNIYVRVTKTTNTDRGGHFVGHLGYQLSGKLGFKLEREFEKKPSMYEFRSNPIKNDKVRVTTPANKDLRQPFCRPSWLSIVGQNPYSNLNERLMDATHI